jgi:hypothetical protein
MADCEMLPQCSFFNGRMAHMHNTAELYKDQYCKKNSSSCARYMVCKALGKAHVPADLFPNMEAKAQKIIEGFNIIAIDSSAS